ncbi:MAG: putative protease with the C-terminal PDZ domain [Idiomarinaceae bacterium HL-53]|nr:MAG: putative protease with the C-terminal PDZ domain [Idiomarinaceae bacterium HL-53]CUS49032.1 Predicted metalloprotease, contains C-terminal PDZ domain [Idiomarinaceae bacterium HL-53]
MIQYTLRLDQPQHHYFDVTMQIPSPAKDGQILYLPAWIPGSYMIRDFAKHIVEFEARCEGKTLTYERLDKSTWKIEPATGPLVIQYRVYAFDASIRAAYLDFNYGFANGTSVFLAAKGFEQVPQQVSIESSSHPSLAGWQVATTLQGHTTKDTGFGSYIAANYDELIDHPILFGELTSIHFIASNRPHRLVLVGKHYASKEHLASDLARICEEQHQLWGEVPDFKRYDFLTIVTQNGFGGLEHRSSTALMCPRGSLEFGSGDLPRPEYVEFLSLCSHEYFHNWNIKRLKPQAFIPYQLGSESYTPELWWYEGVTSYYDVLMLYRAGVVNLEAFLSRLNQTLTRGLREPGSTRQALSESSFLAWTTFYQQNENAVNAISNYYAKGAVLAFYLDLKLHLQHSSLDDLLRLLWEKYGKNSKGTTMNIIFNEIEKLAGKSVFQDIEALVTQPTQIKVDELVEHFGLKLQRSATHPITLQPTSEPRFEKVELGAALKEAHIGMEVQRVIEGSAAAFAGLSAKDTLIAIDGLQANASQILRVLMNFTPGETCTVHFMRDQRLLERELTWQAPRMDNLRLEVTNASHLPWHTPQV